MQCDDDDFPEEYMIEETEELLNKELYFRIDIKKATGLPAELCKDVFVIYKFKHEPDKEYRTSDCVGKNPNPVFNYTKQHHIDLISEYHLDYFKTGHIVFKTYGQPDFGAVARIEEPQEQVGSSNNAGSPNRKSVAGAGSKSFSDSAKKGGLSEPVAVGSSPGDNSVTRQAGDNSVTRIDESGKGGDVTVADGKKGSACCTIF